MAVNLPTDSVPEPPHTEESLSRGPLCYENWRALDLGRDLKDAYELPLFTDAHVTGELTEGYGPYQFLNPVPAGLPARSLKPGVFLVGK